MKKGSARGKAGFDVKTEDARLKTIEEKSLEGKSRRITPPTQPPKCPECGSSEVWLDGHRYKGEQKIQRYFCRRCGRCFSDSTFNKFADSKVELNIRRQLIKLFDSGSKLTDQRVFSPQLSSKKLGEQFTFPRREDAGFQHITPSQNITDSVKLKSFSYNSNNRRVCAAETKVVKNLTEVAPAKGKAKAETLAEKKTGVNVDAQQLQEMKGKIIEYAWFLKKEGYKEKTIFTQCHLLKLLVKRGADLFDSESVKKIIALQEWAESTKSRAVAVFTTFLRRFMGQTWSPPKYNAISKIPFIPTEREIDTLIAGCGRKTAPFLLLLKETAVRSGEALKLMWADVDVERKIITVTPEKGSNPRIFKVSSQLISTLNSLPKVNERVFGKSNYNSLQSSFTVTRKRMSQKLGNPRLLKIHFHTLRHWKATMLYHQTKDILYVKKFLGHKNVENTLLYIQLEDALFQQSDEFTVRVAETVDDAVKLLEVGFEYVTEMATGKDGSLVKIFRKRK